MENPFAKRATEHVRDDEAFLALIAPEPVTRFLGPLGRTGQLYDRLIVVRGTPGSGKTTLATLFEYPKVATLLRHGDLPNRRGLVAALTECGAIDPEGRPTLAGCRLALESEYRDLWQFPYPDAVKTALTTALIQSRAVLGWIRNLRASGADLSSIRVVPRIDAHAAIDAAGGTEGADVLARAREVEAAIYGVTAAIVPPAMNELESTATAAYRPLDVIDRLQVRGQIAGEAHELNLMPLLILDDAHYLHPDQLAAVQEWLRRKELRVARWVLARLDVLTPRDVLAPVPDPEDDIVDLPGITEARDILHISLQGGLGGTRRTQRTAFRKMARSMADRYLAQWPLFASRDLTSLSAFLQTEPAPVSEGKRAELATALDRSQSALSITAERRALLEREVEAYAEGNPDVTWDVKLAMALILMHRYANRVPQSDLFSANVDPEPARALKVDASLAEGARIQLLHWYNRPYYYGIDALCDASSENAEQFLQLASVLVDLAATQLTRRKRASLTGAQQHRELRKQAESIVDNWNFPLYRSVRRLVDAMAVRCQKTALEPNAWLGPGPNAFGVPQTEFDDVAESHPELARTLQFGIAYNALSLVPRYNCKGEEWCLLELGGVIALKHGLALHRGNFIETRVSELERILAPEGESS